MDTVTRCDLCGKMKQRIAVRSNPGTRAVINGVDYSGQTVCVDCVNDPDSALRDGVINLEPER